MVTPSRKNDNPTKTGLTISQFATRAEIPKWSDSFDTRPKQLPNYNNDLHIESYQKSEYHTSGQQRKGIFESVIGATDRHDHIVKACSLEFPLAKDIKLPEDLELALDFHTNTPSGQLRSFWAAQAARLASLAKRAEPTQAAWDALIPPTISYAAKGVRPAVLAPLLLSQGMGGANWLAQFVFGFPIVGELAQEGVFPQTTKKLPPPITPDSLFTDATSRFIERSRHSASKNDAALWKEAVAQVERGWLGPPDRVTDQGRAARSPADAINLAFRFGVSQQDKLRACDDLRHSGTNAACLIRTPNSLPTWDHIAQMALKGAASQPNWSFFKEDHASAYKWLPLLPAHARFATIILRSPTDGLWYSFAPRALLFGSTASVLHYTCLSRIIASLACRLLGIPMVGYIDDFGALCRTELLTEAQIAFRSLCQAIGVCLKPDKADAGNQIVFLGLKGTFPSLANGRQLLVTLPDEKANKWADEIVACAQANAIQRDALEKLIGKISFSQTALFGKFPRTMISPLYKKLHAKQYRAFINLQEKRIFEWWASTIRSLKPRIATPKPKFPEFILYTDAATKTNTLAAILLRPQTFLKHSRVELVLTAEMPKAWATAFSSTNLIEGMEMLSVVAFLYEKGPSLEGKSLAIYVDNNCALSALVSGTAQSEVLANLVQLFWFYAQKYNIKIWLERAPSTKNIADLPTRSQRIPYLAEQEGLFSQLSTLYEALKAKMSGSQHEKDLLAGAKPVSNLLKGKYPTAPIRSAPYPPQIKCSLARQPARLSVLAPRLTTPRALGNIRQ